MRTQTVQFTLLTCPQMKRKRRKWYKKRTSSPVQRSILEGEEDIKFKKPETDSGCDEKMSEDSETIKSGDISVKTAEKKVMEHNPVLNIPVNRKADVQASYCVVLIVYLWNMLFMGNIIFKLFPTLNRTFMINVLIL